MGLSQLDAGNKAVIVNTVNVLSNVDSEINELQKLLQSSRVDDSSL